MESFQFFRRLVGSVFLMALLLAGLLSCKPAAPVQPKKTRQNPSAHQLRIVMHNFVSSDETVTEVQVAHDGTVHIRESRGNEISLDLVTDGNREFLLNAQGKYEEVHGDAAGVLAEWQEKGSFDSLFQGCDEKPLLTGQETIDSIITSVYSWTVGGNTVMPAKYRAWIAIGDHRPLKRVEDLWSYNKNNSKEVLVQTTTTLYSYDVAVKVTLPTP